MNIHQIIYRVGAVGISVTVLAVIAYVVVFANSRQSGSTGIDAAKIMHMRYAAQEKMKEERALAEATAAE